MALPRLTRRQLVQLGTLVVGGVAVSRLIRDAGPIGRDVDRAAADAATRDPGSPTSGPAKASLRLAVFTDYRCPACRRAYPALTEAVRTDGDVRIVYKDWPIFGAASEHAARVAVASAEQGIYPAVHGALMTDGRPIGDAMLRDVVMAAGGDWARLSANLATHAADVTARLRANGLQALALGLPGTPGYVAGATVVVGAIGESGFRRLFAAAR